MSNSEDKTKGELLEKLEGLEDEKGKREREAGLSLRPFVNNTYIEAFSRSEKIKNGLKKQERRKLLEAEIKDLEEDLKLFPQTWGNIQALKMDCLSPRNEEKLKEFLPRLQRLFEETAGAKIGTESKLETKADYLRLVESVEMFYKFWEAKLSKRKDEAKKELLNLRLSPSSLDISSPVGKPGQQELFINYYKEVKEEAWSVATDGKANRILLYVFQKLGPLFGKTKEQLEEIAKTQFLTTKEIQEITYKNGRPISEQMARKILTNFCNLCTEVYITAPRKGKDREGDKILSREIALFEFENTEDKNGNRKKKPYINPRVLEEVQKHGTKMFFPSLSSEKIARLSDFALRLLYKLAGAQRQLEAFNKWNNSGVWLSVNMEYLFEFLNVPFSPGNGHNNRRKAEFLEAVRQLTKEGIFNGKPFFTLRNERNGFHISEDPSLKPLKHFNENKTAWGDFRNLAFVFRLAFDTMEEQAHVKALEGLKRKRERAQGKRRGRPPKKTPKANRKPEALKDDLEGLISSKAD